MNTSPLFGQLIVAIVTPMHADGEVDWPGLERLVTTCLEQGADGFVTTATTGESATLSDAEKIKVARVTKTLAGSSAKVILGGASNVTSHAVELVREGARAGVDGLLVVTPYYVKPTQTGILTHFRTVADATDLPVMLYDIPGRTGKPIAPETLIAASEHPNIVAVKDAKGDLAEVSRILNETDLLYYSGDDARTLPEMAIGGVGCVTVTGNIAAASYRALIDAVDANDLETARVYHGLLEPLVRATMTHVPGTVATKYLLRGLGRLGSDRVRLPLVGPTRDEIAAIESDVAAVHDVPGVDFSDFRPDRAATAEGALL
ncbi:MAG: 4-hydroxy-tetrahydrodipicolinate synthase [Microbacteriaceae bacterium]|jgi:4-hydroxy-tetrahydrodipicolinate synthase|nr:4-hydroxy-tetrahydrodipicolinate synthase [Microbacteriaceae bacterium]MCI1207042.1 4-hydroxy-tetrahydrodipicolinate synthase [Microbacteriaceae bacterium]